MLKLFPFRAYDYKPAEQWLNQMAAQGFELEYITLFYIAKFRKTDTPGKYAAVLWQQPNLWGSKEEFNEFTDFLTGFGWEFVTDKDAIRIFRAPSDTAKAPMMSDAVSEAMQTHRRYWRAFKLGLIFTIAYLAFMTLYLLLGDAPTLMLARPISILMFFLAAYILMGLVLQTYHYRRFMRAKRMAQDLGEPLPVRSINAAKQSGMLYMLAAALFIAVSIIIVIWDVSMDASHIGIIPNILYAVSLSLLLYTIKNKRKKAKAAYSLKLGLLIPLCAISIALMFIYAGREDTDPTVPEGMPVMVLSIDETPVRSAFHTQTPLMRLYTYTGSLSDSKGIHHSVYVDCISEGLARAAYRELAYGYSILPKRFRFDYKPEFELLDLPFADEAMYASNDELIVLRKGTRVMRAQHLGYGKIELPLYIETIRGIFAERQSE